MLKKNLVVILLVLMSIVNVFALDFPLRAKYPTVKPISVVEVKNQFKNIVIVDVRSELEYNIIHAKSARHIALSNPNFDKMIKRLYDNNKTKTLVFYCNGRTCAKSYKVCVKAQKIGIDNVKVMDEGILVLTKKYPELSFLMGENPADLKKLIPTENFKSHLLPPEKFVDSINSNPKALVIDSRDKSQRNPKILPKISKNFPFKEMFFVAKKAMKDGKTLYIYDNVGKQVRWLQYYLEKAKIKDYYFMKGGVRAYIAKFK